MLQNEHINYELIFMKKASVVNMNSILKMRGNERMKNLKLGLYVLIIVFLVGCKSNESENKLDESTYTKKIEVLESQIGLLNTVIDDLTKKNSSYEVELSEYKKETTFNDVKVDPRSISLGRVEEFIGNALLQENKMIKLSPYEDAETIVQLEEKLPVYVQYIVYNNLFEEWALVYYADTSIGYVLKTDLIDVDEPSKIVDGTIVASGIYQNRSYQEIVHMFGYNYMIERRESNAIIFDIEGISDLVLDCSKESGLIYGFTIRTSEIPLDSGIKVGDLIDDALKYYNKLYPYIYIDELHIFKVTDTESLVFSTYVDENDNEVIGQISINKPQYPKEY